MCRQIGLLFSPVIIVLYYTSITLTYALTDGSAMKSLEINTMKNWRRNLILSFPEWRTALEQTRWLSCRLILFQELNFYFLSLRRFFLRPQCLGADRTTLALSAQEWKLPHAQKTPHGPNWTCSKKEPTTPTKSKGLLEERYHHPSCQL